MDMVEGAILANEPAFLPEEEMDLNDIFIDNELPVYDYLTGDALDVTKEDCEIHVFTVTLKETESLR